MHYLKTLAGLLALALVAMAVTAAAASAVVKDTTLGGTASSTSTGAYNGSISGTDNGTIDFGAVTCNSATLSGTVDGTANTATLSLGFATGTVGGTPGTCSTSGGSVICDVDPIINVNVTFSPTSGGDGVITQASNFSTTVTCGGFPCTWSSTTTTGGGSTAGVGPVTANFSASANTASLNDTMRVTGIGCASADTLSGAITVEPITLEVW